MKCALALVAEAAANKTAREEAERLAKEEKARREAEELARRIARSIHFCETVIAPALQKKADNGYVPTAAVLMCRSGKEVCHVKKRAESRYVDGRSDYDYSWVEEMDVQHIKDYLAEHCFTITVEMVEEYSYGSGLRDFEQWTIKPSPACL